ncbi:formylglycine-generating enzyme family protein [Alphaproteobacteria bacterium KMM 3653]|uniref:Formylglycine-generating enzyme family protein n=1 Tax=Harenicola maris TaxID=2841044 RepID=A0AAP2CQ17_9RHOB|nr:formylglycine-generating enzyme family protein [Harenicola maris]
MSKTPPSSKTPPVKACCTPAAQARPPAVPPLPKPSANAPVGLDNAALIPGGTALIGTAEPFLPADEESPPRFKKVKPFRMGRAAVTNAEFARFIEETAYVTEAERFGWSFVFYSDLAEGHAETEGVQGVDWWRRSNGANWRDINGPGSQAQAWHPDHPVVQVSWNDARAYAKWAGGRLPSEVEWEHAARGGQGDVRFPWGDKEPNDTDTFPCNIWQGQFPHMNSAADGYKTTAPAQSFDSNAYGLFNMVGNVWEWTAEPFRLKSLRRGARDQQAARRGYKLLKGGSFLCHRSYCYRYRIAARTGNAPDTSTTHQGFRMVWDAA